MPSYTELNIELVEEFGHLERLCGQIYNEQHGVTCYIENMKGIYGGALHVPNWNSDLRMLISVRDKRNKLSHSEVPFSSSFAIQEDIDFINEFRSRIMNSTDPLTLHRRANESKPAPKPAAKSNHSASNHDKQPYISGYHRVDRPAGCLTCIALISAVTIFAIWLILNL